MRSGFRRAITGRLRRFAGCERGTQLVELAIALPVLLVMFAAAAEFGRFFYTYTTLTKATRAAARFLTVEPADGSKDGAAKNLAVYGNTEGEGDPIVAGLTADQVVVTRTGGAASSGLPEKVKVEIQGYTYEPLFDLGSLVGNQSLSLNVAVQPSTTMRYFLSTPS